MVKLKSKKYLQVPQAVLDLHGYLLSEAEWEVEEFLDEARKKNYRFVRIITGKGEVLRPWLIDYLEMRILKYRQSMQNEGGDGAFDIIL